MINTLYIFNKKRLIALRTFEDDFTALFFFNLFNSIYDVTHYKGKTHVSSRCAQS